MTDPTPLPTPDNPSRYFHELIDTGLLWLINRTVLHPQGLSLALHVDNGGFVYGWSLEADQDPPTTFAPDVDTEGLKRWQTTLRELRP